MSKSSLRKLFKEKLSDLRKSENWESYSKIISLNIMEFLSHLDPDPTKNIGLFYPINGEVNITPIFDKLKNIAFPRILCNETYTHMEYASINSINDLVQSKYNFKEPNKSCRKILPDILLIPGLAFDKKTTD